MCVPTLFLFCEENFCQTRGAKGAQVIYRGFHEKGTPSYLGAQG